MTIILSVKIKLKKPKAKICKPSPENSGSFQVQY